MGFFPDHLKKAKDKEKARYLASKVYTCDVEAIRVAAHLLSPKHLGGRHFIAMIKQTFTEARLPVDSGVLTAQLATLGDPKAAWFVGCALSSPDDPRSKSFVEGFKIIQKDALADNPMSADFLKTCGSIFVVNSAFGKQPDASNVLRKIVGKMQDEDDPRTAYVLKALKQVEKQTQIPILSDAEKSMQLYNTFLLNVVTHHEQSEIPKHQDRLQRLKELHDTKEMLQRQQNQLSEYELSSIRATLAADDFGL